MTNLDTLHLRSHAESVCRDWHSCAMEDFIINPVWRVTSSELYAYSLDILCLMALTEALGLEYGGFVN